ncbi:MAG: O-antigen ligase family protein [bacterium]
MKYVSNQTSKKILIISLFLWLMLWGGYNTGIERLIAPGFPSGALDLFHGLRALLPPVAACLAIIMLLARHPLSLQFFKGPLGLLVLYAIVGILSSIFLSLEPLIALYWAIQYVSVLIVLWLIFSMPDPSAILSRLIIVNWIIAGIITVGLFAFLIFKIGMVPLETSGDFLVGRPYEGIGGIGAAVEILGMPGTRPTGLGRYAGVAALGALAMFWRGKKWWEKTILLLLFFFFLFILVFSRGRAGILAFAAGAIVILWLHKGRKIFFVSVIFIMFLLLLLGLTGFYQAFWTYLVEKMPFVFTLSGRTTGVWPEGWRLFLSSPLLGYGFHADRIFLEGQHMHNALLHALTQAGIIGGIPFVAALINVWTSIMHIYRGPKERYFSLPLEIPVLVAFFTVLSITESTFAFYGAVWLFSAPLFAYIQCQKQLRKGVM